MMNKNTFCFATVHAHAVNMNTNIDRNAMQIICLYRSSVMFFRPVVFNLMMNDHKVQETVLDFSCGMH